jgi:gas vesicle protein GvpA/GvpJ/GvpM family
VSTERPEPRGSAERPDARLSTERPDPRLSPERSGFPASRLAAPGANALPGRPNEPANLADILERVLDKGIVIAGDIQINLLDIELLTIKLRLLIASVERAREMGINWWEGDPSLQRIDENGGSRGDALERENRELRERIERLERHLGSGDEESSRGSTSRRR